MIPTAKNLENAKILWDYHCRIDQLDKVSNDRIIIGLGSYDLRVAAYCAKLYLDGYANKILFSGKSGNWTVGRWNKTEAEVFAELAIKGGVPEKDILLEKEATNIGENVQYSKELLKKSGITSKEIILITKPNTTRRAYASFMVYWPEITPLLSAPDIKFNNPPEGYSTESLINELVGDLDRIISYPEKGFQIYQEIPKKVLEAYFDLRQAGYNQHSPDKQRFTAIK